jgi:hypothetical protein
MFTVFKVLWDCLGRYNFTYPVMEIKTKLLIEEDNVNIKHILLSKVYSTKIILSIIKNIAALSCLTVRCERIFFLDD